MDNHSTVSLEGKIADGEEEEEEEEEERERFSRFVFLGKEGERKREKETTFHGSFMFKERAGPSTTTPSPHSNRRDFVGVISPLQRVPLFF